MVVATANCLTSILAGFVVFSFVGFMAVSEGKDIDEVVAKGPGLAFVVYPNALSLVSAPKVLSVCFFSMLLFLGFGTQFSLLETIVCIILDTWPKLNRLLVLGCSCFAMFLVGLSMVTQGGMYVLQLMDDYVGTFNALICGCAEILVLGYFYGIDRFLVDIQTMFGWKKHALFDKVWVVMWRFVTPLVITLIFVASCIGYKPLKYNGQEYPLWANVLGWLVTSVGVMMIPIGMGVKLFKEQGGSFKQRWSKLTKPDARWGPRLAPDRRRAKERWIQFGYVANNDENQMLN